MRSGRLLSLFVSATVCVASLTNLSSPAAAVPPPCATISECAYQLINQRVAENHSLFSVYRDADSAFNHGFPSGLFFSTDINPTSIVIDSGCLDASGSFTGCATDSALMDQTRGTVFRV